MSQRTDFLKTRMSNNPMNNMFITLEYLGTGNRIVPEADKYYLFVYTPKTKGIQYDQHPFILCTSVHKWGFIGINMHWDDHRRYTWQEVESNLFEINDDEVQDVAKLPLMLVKQS